MRRFVGLYGIDANPPGGICFLCGEEERPHHICPAIWAGAERGGRVLLSKSCPLGHDKQGNKKCPTCKAAYDHRRYLARRGAA